MGSQLNITMKILLSLFVLCCLFTAPIGARKMRPSKSNNAAATTVATTASATTATTDSSAEDDDEYMLAAKALIDAGTCDSVSSNSVCGGDSDTSYFKDFQYNGYRVVISNGIPDHEAEHDAPSANPNTRCERWQFMAVPTNPSKSSTAVSTEMGTVGLASTGGQFFNDLSDTDGSVALANEGTSLDSCFGHSASGGVYHYHANINCTDAGSATGANDPDQCVHIGYYRDGVPVYGLCKDSNGDQMTSCYSMEDGSETTDVTCADGATYTVADNDQYYTYDSTNEGCNLDEGNGATHPTTGEYSYFMTTGYPWVPIYYSGDEGASSLCSLGY